MKAVVFHGVGDIRPDEVPEPQIAKPADAIEAYKAFAKRKSGWVKVELKPAS